MLDPRSQRPRLASRLAGLGPSLYARILQKLAQYPGEVYPFHIGETHLLPPPEVFDALRGFAEPALHHYAAPQGTVSLREAIAARLEQTGMSEVHAADLVITHGATHGLNLACQAILDPGDVMLVLSPHWPLINHMVHTASAVPIEVPFTCQLRKEGASAYDLLKAHLHPRARAVYLTSPNNPDGVVLTREELADVARFCIEHDIYALVDEAYEHFHFTKRAPRLARFEGMEDRTITVFTFSKSHRMAGVRVLGYTVAPPDVRDGMIKLANISIYNVSLVAQSAALAAIEAGPKVVEETSKAALEARNYFCAALEPVAGIRFSKPEGGAYVFADMRELLDGRDCLDLLDRALDDGVVFAPGRGFGRMYEGYARFCFTAMDRPHLERGTERLVAVLQEAAGR